MIRHVCIAFGLAVFGVGSALSAANPVTKEASKTKIVWTNDAVEQLSAKGLISVIGRVPEETTKFVAPAVANTPTKYSQWFSAQAVTLQSQLERRQGELRGYRQTLQDARDLKTTTGGVNLLQDNIGITPDAAIEILQRRVQETQRLLNELEDLARQNDIAPGILRGK